MRRWWHKFQQWNTEQACQRARDLTCGAEPCKHIFAAPEHKLPRLKLDLVYLSIRTDIALSVWAWCVSRCWLEWSNSELNVWVNIAVERSLILEEQQTTSNWSLFFHTSYACGEKWSISSSLPIIFANKTGISTHKKHK